MSVTSRKTWIIRVTRRKLFSYFQLAAVGLLAGAATAAFAQDGDAKAALQQRLNQTFTATTVSADRNSIVTPGSVLVVQKGGMTVYAVASPLPPGNTYKNGKITQGFSGFGRDLSISMLTPGAKTSAGYPQRKLAVGEKVWLTQAVVEKDTVSILVYTDPDASAIRYYGELKFPFGKGPMPPLDVALHTVEEVLTVQTPDNPAASGQQQQAPPAPIRPETASAQAQTSAPAPMPAIAPPPPPADQAPPTIKLGDTKDQVIAAIGQPQKVVDYGTKEVDYYPDMKVTLVKGKVTNVQ